jgi:hypothetical protein
MFNLADVNEYEHEFWKLGITDTEEMKVILDTLAELADVTYYIFKNNL